MQKIFFILILVLHTSSAVIYSVNSTLYYKMPPVFHFDNYHMCLNEPKGIYCTAKITLVSDPPNELLYMIQNYSEHRVKHYNHTSLRYGICVTESCRNHFNDKQKDIDMKKLLEECLDSTFLKKYDLKAKIGDPLVCNTLNDQMKYTNLDYVVAAICLTLLMLNVIGTAYHILYHGEKEKKENKLLMMFSIKKNWQKLVSPSEETHTRLVFITGFNGLRTIMTALVITTHSLLPFVNSAHNTREIEAIYDNLFLHTFINGPPIVQVFFILSGFLLAYNTLNDSEKKEMTWHMIPKKICLRWLRLTPAYGLILAITSTWLRFAGTGPLWHEAVITEAEDCRRDGWQNLLYINNYFDNTQCLAETWYLAADMQLYCLGVLICILCKTNTVRKVVLSLLFVIGMIIPGVITFKMDLDAVTIISPELCRNYFISDATYHYVYKRGHTNIPSYVIGLSMGFITYYLKERNFDVQKYKKYLWTYQFLFPFLVMITWMGSIFYRDAPRESVYFRAAYATFVKPMFALTLALYIMGLVFKCDKFNNQLMEWRLWTTTARLSYCAYIIHIKVVRTYFGSMDTLTTVLFTHMFHNSISAIVISFLLATPYWLMVEAPMNALVNHLITPSSARQGTERSTKITKMD